MSCLMSEKWFFDAKCCSIGQTAREKNFKDRLLLNDIHFFVVIF